MRQLIKIVTNVTYDKIAETREPLFEIGLVIGDKNYTECGSMLESETVRFYLNKSNLKQLGENLIEMSESGESININE